MHGEINEKWRGNILMCFLVMALCFCWGKEVKADNTDINSASQIQFGTTYSGSLTNTAKQKFYKFVLPSSGKISISFDADMGHAYCSLYDEELKSVESQYLTRKTSTNQINSQVSYDLTGGVYYLKVDDGEGTFQLKIDYVSANESFAEKGNGTNNTIGTANSVNLGTSYIGQLASTDEKDFYKVELSSSGCLTLTFSGDFRNSNIYLYDAKGESLTHNSVSISDVTNKADATCTYYLIKGTYYFEVESSYYTGNYSFKLGFVSANESFVETGKDNYIGGGNFISLNQKYRGQISTLCDDVDFFAFTANSSGEYQIDFESDIACWISIYDRTEDKVFYHSTSTNKNTGKHELKRNVSLSAGTYYLRVDTNQYPGNYTLSVKTVNKKPGKVTISTVKSTKKKTAVVKWKSVSDAAGYQVQYAKSKSFKGKKTAYVYGTSKTIKKLSRKKRYYVRVRAFKVVNGSYQYGKWSSVKSVKVK